MVLIRQSGVAAFEGDGSTAQFPIEFPMAFPDAVNLEPRATLIDTNAEVSPLSFSVDSVTPILMRVRFAEAPATGAQFSVSWSAERVSV